MVTLANFLSLPSLKMMSPCHCLEIERVMLPCANRGDGANQVSCDFLLHFLDGGCSAPPVMLSDDLRCYVDIG